MYRWNVPCPGLPNEIKGNNISILEVFTLANIKSAKKRVKVTEVKTLQNKMFRTQLKTDIKKYQAAIAAGDTMSSSCVEKSSRNLIASLTLSTFA